ncbi:hypothetical protein Tco_0710167 [Tanacetum coccineum]
MVRKKELRLGAGLYDSWKLQGDVEELWDELAKLGLGLRCCFALVVPRLRKEEKGGDKATWGPSIDLRLMVRFVHKSYTYEMSFIKVTIVRGCDDSKWILHTLAWQCDDDALLFVTRSLPMPVSWLGSHTKNVNAAGTGSGSATISIISRWVTDDQIARGAADGWMASYTTTTFSRNGPTARFRGLDYGIYVSTGDASLISTRLFYGRFSFYDPSVDIIKEVKQETDIQEKDKKKAKNDKTEHGMEKTKSNRSQSQSKSESQPRQSQKSTK